MGLRRLPSGPLGAEELLGMEMMMMMMMIMMMMMMMMMIIIIIIYLIIWKLKSVS